MTTETVKHFKETKHRVKRGVLQAVSCYHHVCSYIF